MCFTGGKKLDFSHEGWFSFGVKVKRELKIKFRPIKPRSPHLNGKVERTQRTDLDEFYSSVDPIHDSELQQKLKKWQNYYNIKRPHTSLEGKTPFEKYQELQDKIPTIEKIHEVYDSKLF